MENDHIQIKKNFISNILNLLINVAIGLFYTPYLVRSLGIIAYGILPLALIVNQYIGTLTTSLTGSFTRFYSIALKQKKYTDASKYLSSALFAITIILISLFPIILIIIAKIDYFFNVPIEFVKSTKILFSLTIISFCFSLFSSLLNVTLYANNRLDKINTIRISGIIIKTFLIILFFESIKKDIAYIGYSSLVAEFSVFAFSFYHLKKEVSNRIKISFRNFEKNALISIIAMTSWVIVHQIGAVGIYNIDIILINKFWSTKESGILGALNSLGTYVTTVISVFSTLFGPVILLAYAQKNHKKVKKLTLRSSLYVGVIGAVLIGILIGFAKPIISFWLGIEYLEYSNWLVFKIITLPFYVSSGIFAFVFRAWNQVKIPAILTLITGIINFIISFLVCTLSNGNTLYINYMLLFSVFIVLINSYILNTYIFYRIYSEIPKYSLIIIFVKIAFTVAISFFVTTLYVQIININSVYMLLISLLIAAIVCSLIVFYIVFNKVQRNNLIKVVNGFKL